jgi:hypothetical protein
VWLGVGLWLDARGVPGPGWLPWWSVVTVALVAAVGLGWVLGGRALRERLPVLVRVAQDEGAAEDDW